MREESVDPFEEENNLYGYPAGTWTSKMTRGVVNVRLTKRRYSMYGIFCISKCINEPKVAYTELGTVDLGIQRLSLH
ncbi:hypothetical protein TNCV_3631811 [Trichonephila clavipes]|nr:hypothetical protein TNCV_3631811 [Trichonephila clavipes]